MTDLIRTQAVDAEPGARPGIRLVVDHDGAAATTLAIHRPDQRWPVHYWIAEGRDAGRFGCGVKQRPGTIVIPAADIAALLGQPIPEQPTRNEVAVLVRTGKRNLRPGQTVRAQPKQRKGTGKVDGIIETCWDDGTVTVATGVTTFTVDADWVQAKNGSRA
jgi:hypothetical protein